MNRSPSRRQFVQGVSVAGLGLLAGCGRLPWQTQPPPTRIPRIGYLSFNAAGPDASRDAFLEGLGALGWADGQNLVIDYRFADGNADRLRELAAELARSEVALLFAPAPAPDAAKQATSTRPIVVIHADPVGTHLVDSLAHPGGNITGLTFLAPELAGKRLQLLTEAFPGASRVAALWNPANLPMAREYGETFAAASALGVELQSFPVRDPGEFETTFEAMTREHIDALVVIADIFLLSQRTRVVELVAQHRLPAIYTLTPFVAAGGLITYTPSSTDLFRRAASYVDKILKGAKPADLPIELPMRFDLVINLKTAQALGLTIPPHVLLQATEVIQ